MPIYHGRWYGHWVDMWHAGWRRPLPRTYDSMHRDEKDMVHRHRDKFRYMMHHHRRYRRSVQKTHYDYYALTDWLYDPEEVVDREILPRVRVETQRPLPLRETRYHESNYRTVGSLEWPMILLSLIMELARLAYFGPRARRLIREPFDARQLPNSRFGYRYEPGPEVRELDLNRAIEIARTEHYRRLRELNSRRRSGWW